MTTSSSCGTLAVKNDDSSPPRAAGLAFEAAHDLELPVGFRLDEAVEEIDVEPAVDRADVADGERPATARGSGTRARRARSRRRWAAAGRPAGAPPAFRARHLRGRDDEVRLADEILFRGREQHGTIRLKAGVEVEAVVDDLPAERRLKHAGERRPERRFDDDRGLVEAVLVAARATDSNAARSAIPSRRRSEGSSRRTPAIGQEGHARARPHVGSCGSPGPAIAP